MRKNQNSSKKVSVGEDDNWQWEKREQNNNDENFTNNQLTAAMQMITSILQAKQLPLHSDSLALKADESSTKLLTYILP